MISSLSSFSVAGDSVLSVKSYKLNENKNDMKSMKVKNAYPRISIVTVFDSFRLEAG